MSHTILAKLETLASKTTAENGFELCGVQLYTHLKSTTLQVQIRHKDGTDVSLEDCARFSAPMDDAIESSDLLDQAYVLEISSPGIDNKLLTDRDFQTFRGFPVEVTFRDEKNAENHRTGLLHQRSSDHVHLNIKGKLNRIPRKDVIGVCLTSPKR